MCIRDRLNVTSSNVISEDVVTGAITVRTTMKYSEQYRVLTNVRGFNESRERKSFRCLSRSDLDF